MSKFRFQDLKIWQMSIQQSDQLLNIADELEQRKLFRFAEQLPGSVLSVSNNIAEGSGSASSKDFANFLNIAHRSAFEVANLLFILQRRSIITKEVMKTELNQLDIICRQITNFRKSLFR